MKKIFFLVPIILLVAASCNQSAKDNQIKSDQKDQGQQAALPDNNLPQGEKTGWNNYANGRYGYEFQYPKNWVLVQVGDPIKEKFIYVASAKRAEGDIKPASVDVAVYDKTQTLDDFVNKVILPGFKGASVSNVTFAGQDAKKIVASSNASVYLYVTVKGSYIYELTVDEKQLRGGPTPGQEEDLSGTVRQILSTFKFASSSANANQDEMANWKTYTDTEYSFSFKYPQDFPFAQVPKGTPGAYNDAAGAYYIYSVPGPRGAGEVIADVVVIPANNFRIDVQMQPIKVANLDQISALYPNDQISKIKTNAGATALKVFLSQNNKNGYFATYFILKGDYVYEFRNWSAKDDQKFLNIVSSFK